MIIDKKHTEDLEILGKKIKLGESRKLNFNTATLFTGTAVDVPVFIERSINPRPTVLKDSKKSE
jgi:hypothetical protein